MPDVLPDVFTSIDGQQFLLWYETYTEDDGGEAMFMIFGTVRDLEYLINAEHLSVDGTFSPTPLPFYAPPNARSAQLFTINSLYGLPDSQRLYTRLYVLTTRRTERFYRLMYAAIFQIFADNIAGFTPTRLNWKRVSMDFELAHISAMSAVSDAYFLAIGKRRHIVSLVAFFSDMNNILSFLS